MIKLLNNTTNQLSKFRIRNWVEINDDTIFRFMIQYLNYLIDPIFQEVNRLVVFYLKIMQS